MARLVTTPTASHTARAAAVYAQAIEGGASVRYLPVAVADYDLASSTPEIKGGSGNKRVDLEQQELALLRQTFKVQGQSFCQRVRPKHCNQSPGNVDPRRYCEDIGLRGKWCQARHVCAERI